MRRWGEQKPIHIDEREMRTGLGSGNFIFVGSGCDVFADNVPEGDINRVLEKVRGYKDNKYLFQTRNVRNLKKYIFPADAVIGTTIETNRYWVADEYSYGPPLLSRVRGITSRSILNRMITIEPVMDFDPHSFFDMVLDIKPLQVNIGADSGNNGLPEPDAAKIGQLIERLARFTKIHLKKNLARLFQPQGGQ
jgi:hypothetical protein